MIDIYLYRFYGRKNQIYKTELTGDIHLTGEFRDAVNIINPQFVIEYDANGTTQNLLKMNYVYIPVMKRYYFITNIELTRKNLITLSLHVDVLTSHYNVVKTNSHGYLSRNEYNYNLLLPDDRRILRNTYTKTYITGSWITSGALVNTTFDTTNISSSTKNIVIVCADTYSSGQREIVSNRVSAGRTQTYNTIGTFNTAIKFGFLSTPTKQYVATLEKASYLIADCYTDDNLASFVSSITVYPFVPEMGTTPARTFYVGDKNIKDLDNADVEIDLLKNVVSTQLTIADFTVSEAHFSINDFNHLSPYAFYQMYIPFYGFLEFDINKYLGTRIIVYYIVNYLTNNATVYVVNYTLNETMLCSKVNLGRELSLNTTNLKEVNDRQRANALNSFLNVIGGMLAVGGGMATGNPLAIAGGGLAITKTLGSAVTNELTNYKRAQISFNDDITDLVSPLGVYFTKTYRQTAFASNNEFRHENGSPVHAYVSSLTGIYGYTEFAELDIILDTSITGDQKPYAPTTEEINEFIDLCKKGVYFEAQP